MERTGGLWEVQFGSYARILIGDTVRFRLALLQKVQSGLYQFLTAVTPTSRCCAVSVGTAGCHRHGTSSACCAHPRTPHKSVGTRSSSSTVSPPSYTDTVPDEAEITTAVASVTVVMASAAA